MKSVKSVGRLAAAIALGAMVGGAAQARDGLSAGSEGIRLKAMGGDFELNLGGRLHADAVAYDEGAVELQDADLRRARLELSGRIGKLVRFRVDREFAQGAGWRNVWLGLRPTDDLELRAGNVIVPFSMEELQSSNQSALMERSLVTALAPGFSLGGTAQVSKRYWTAALGYYGDALDGEDGRSEERGKGFAGRVTAAPIQSRGRFAHLGASIEKRKLDAEDSLRFQAQPGAILTPSLISSGAIANVSEMTNLGAEAAFSAGPLLLQGQYIRSSIDRLLGDSLDFDGWYAQASFVLTGEDYDYSRRTGSVQGVDLRRKRGSVELAARLSQLDLDDGSFQRGKGQTATVGANWYVNRNVRLMLNHARSSVEDVALSLDRKSHVTAGRFQLSF